MLVKQNAIVTHALNTQSYSLETVEENKREVSLCHDVFLSLSI